MQQFLAFDLGAESGRAMAGRSTGGRLTLHEILRFPNTPATIGDTLRWDIDGLWGHITRALALAGQETTASIGVDAWGCDYALLDDRGSLVEAPFHYRDRRTHGVMEQVTTRLGRHRIYDVTGVQFLPFNTLYQLVAAQAVDTTTLDRAAHFLTIPDLLNYRLTGRMACEYTNATTTQCIDARTRSWATSLLADAGLPVRLFGDIVEPGTVLGPVRDAGRMDGIPVVAPACHDTGSAVAAIDATAGTAFLSSGTWSLLGIETAHPIITARSRTLNFTNEGGVDGTTRLLKNVAGLWLLQSCRRDWAREGTTWSYDDLVSAAAAAPDDGPLVDPDDADFLSPAHMPTAIADYCRRTQQRVPDSHAVFARTIFESLALKYRLVLEWLEEVSDTSIHTVRVIGGGAQNRLLNQLTADVTRRTVAAGPVEATALGNIAMQMLATGHVASLADARALIERSFPSDICAPANTERWEAPYQRFRGYVEWACA